MKRLNRALTLKPIILLQLVLVAMLAGGGVALAAIAPTTVDKTIPQPFIENYTLDTDVNIASLGVSPNAGAAAEALSGEMVDTTFNQLTTAVVAGNYIYEFEFKESAVDALASTCSYTIKVWVEGTLTATFTADQNTVDDINIEGVKCTVDVGSGGYPSEIEIHAVIN